MKVQTKKEFCHQTIESKKTGSGKAPACPTQIRKMEVDVIPASVKRLRNDFDEDYAQEKEGVLIEFDAERFLSKYQLI